MDLFNKLKAQADANGDGKINKDDLEALRSEDNTEMLEELKDIADQNDDGKIDLNDLKNFNLGDTINDAKNLF